MKAKDVAFQNGFSRDKFEAFLIQSKYKSQVDDTIMGLKIDDRADVSAIVRDYKKYEEDLVIKANEDAKVSEEKRAAWLTC